MGGPVAAQLPEPVMTPALYVFAAIVVVLWGLTAWLYRLADHAGDDFGTGALFFVCAVVAVICTVIWILAWLWSTHT